VSLSDPPLRGLIRSASMIRHWSTLTPAKRITFDQRSASCRMNIVISAGVWPSGSALKSASHLATSGCFSASAIAAESLYAISGGVLGGGTRPNREIREACK